MKIAYSTIKLKSASERGRQFSGIASTPTPDRDGDIVMPEGVKYSLPVPLLWQHDSREPIGSVTTIEVTEHGLSVEAELVEPSPDMPPRMKARLDEAWHSIKSGLVRGLSIGFGAIKYSFLDSGGIEFSEWDLQELSVVTVPANQEASITAIKAAAGAFAKSKSIDGQKLPSVVGPVHLKKSGDKNMDLLKEIAAYKEKAAQMRAEQDAMLQKSVTESRTFDAEEAEAFDELDSQIKSVGQHIQRLERMLESQKAAATPVAPEAEAQSAKSVSGAPAIIKVDKEAGEGMAFAQYVRIVGEAKGNKRHAREIAAEKAEAGQLDRRVLSMFEKGAIAAGTVGDDSWAGALVHEGGVVADFVEFLRPQTIIGQFGTNGIPALRSVPHGVPIDIQTTGGDAYWVGEGKPKPLTKWSYDTRKLELYKIATIAALSEELLERATSSADKMIRDELARAIAGGLNKRFADETQAGSSGVSPASILYGAAYGASATKSGAWASNGDNVGTDFEDHLTFLIGRLVAGGLAVTDATIMMGSANAFALSRTKTATGEPAYPNMSAAGGTIDNIPVIVSDDMNAGVVAVVIPSEIYLVDEGGLRLDTSDQVSLEMKDSSLTQDATDGTGTSLVSMWQTNSVAFRAERFMNWAPRRVAAMAYVTGAAYSA